MKKLTLLLGLLLLFGVGSSAQICCQVGSDLITNGDFESPTPFLTSYNLNVPSSASGDYGVVPFAGTMLGPTIACPFFSNHTPGGSRFAIFNQGSAGSSTCIAYSVALVAGQSYSYKFFFNPKFSSSTTYGITVDVEAHNQTYNAGSYSGCQWNEICGTFTATSTGTFPFKIIYTSPTSGIINSFGIDDISLKQQLNVVATQPTLTVCSSDAPFNLGVEHVPTGNVYWTNGFFTPVDGFSMSIPPAGGSFTVLPPVTVNSFPPYALTIFDPGIGAGTYPVEYTYTDVASGCSASATMNIIVEDPPNVAFSPLTFDLCAASTVTIVPFVSAGATCTFSGNPNISATGVFNAAAAGVGGPYNFNITCTSALGACTTTITGQITVVSTGVTVTAVEPLVNLCASSAPITIGALHTPSNNIYWTNGYFTPVDGFSGAIPPPGGSYNLTGLSTGLVVNSYPNFDVYSFDPSLVGPGTYSLVYTYTDPVSGCSGSATMNFVVGEGVWHQTTADAVAPLYLGDSGKDVFTDDEYVYATGSFYERTTFDDGLGNAITINSLQTQERNFYAVCHNSCGELQWVIYDEHAVSNNWSEGFGVNKQGDEILIGFNYNNRTELTTVFPNGSTSVSSFNGNFGTSVIGHAAVIAVEGPISPSFGKINAIEDSYMHHFGTALDVQDNGGLVNTYISGKSDTDQDNLTKVFASRLEYNISGNSFNVNWINTSTQETQFNVANDIKWDQASGRLFITGTFRSVLTMNTATINSPAGYDAFFAGLNPSSGVASPGSIHALGTQSGGRTTGTCLATDDNNYIYFGGDIRGAAPNVYGTFSGGAGSLVSSSVGTSSYIVSFDMGASVLDVKEIYNTWSYTRLTGMDANNDKVNFVGYYDRGLPEITGTVSQATLNTLGSQNNYLFVGSANLNPAQWNDHSIVNSTQITGPLPKYDHIPSRISLGSNYGFITGEYKGYMDYTVGSPVSGVLISSGVNPTTRNAFILRQELATNALKIADGENNLEEVTKNALVTASIDMDDLRIKTYPNPTKGMVTIQIDGHDFEEELNIQIIDLQGKVLLRKQLSNAKTEIDLQELETGIYFVRVQIKDAQKIVRLVKS